MRLAELQWSKMDLAEKMGIPPSSLTTWAQGGKPQAKSLHRLAAALEVDVTWLALGDRPGGAIPGKAEAIDQALADALHARIAASIESGHLRAGLAREPVRIAAMGLLAALGVDPKSVSEDESPPPG